MSDTIQPEVKPELSVLDRTEQAIKKMELMEADLKAREERLSRNMLSGKSDAGQPQVKPPEESPREYAKRIMSGRV